MASELSSAGMHALQKIACGSTHSLFLKPEFKREETEKGGNYAYVGSKVIGWGGNRHNQLGVKPDFDGGKHLESDPGTSWPEVLPTPSADVFANQDPHGAAAGAASHRERHALDIVEVACGGNFSLVLERVRGGEGGTLTESRVYSFGLEGSGTLGRAGEVREGEHGMPGQVKIQLPRGVSGRAVVQRICCGTDHALAIVSFLGSSGSFASAQGRVFAWGLGSFGALGTKSRQDTSVPEEVWFPEDGYSTDPHECERNVVVRQVAAGFKHSLALADVQASIGVGAPAAAGVVYSWGHGGNGRLGLGQHLVGDVQSSSAEFEPKRVELGAGSQIKYIAAGEAHSGAVDQLGGLHTWGQGSHGRLGHGLAMDFTTPARVETLLGIAISQISFGLMHTMATSVKGQLYACGKGPATGLDAGDNVVVATPRLVELPDAGMAKVYQIATGPLHTLVLMSDGVIYYFGSGSGGRMVKAIASADDTVRRDQAFPKKLEERGWNQKEMETKSGAQEALTHAVTERPWWPKQVFCHGANSLTLTSGGALWVWGAGVLSAAGDGEAGLQQMRDELVRWEPAPVHRFMKSVTMVAVGLEHCLAITSDAVMYSWGEGGKGQLGTGSLKPTVSPQPITHPTDVMCISAGEEHSACIIGGGESYTWGSADGGRLGQGGCLSEGVLLQPKQVAITDSATDVLLRSVSCGSQHTAMISEDDRLLTFGTGWFGRLGHGNLDNQFSPKFIQADFRVKEVHCAMYHTCIVDTNSILWVCGRDTATCSDAHVLEPAPFQPFLDQPRRLIVSIAACEQHTLAVTRLESDPRSETELWVWGKNGRGVLGAPETVAPRINSPWQLRLPGFERNDSGKKPDYEIMQVATAPHHSLCLVRPRARKGQQMEQEPVAYAWGSSICGRLGLATGIAAANAGVNPNERERPVVEPPSEVEPSWRPVIEEAFSAHDNHQAPSKANLDLRSKTWFDCQEKLYFEKKDYKKHKLLDRANEVGKLYHGFLKDLLSLWSKPEAGGNITEYNLRQKERELECQYVRTLKALDLAGSTHAPKIANGRIQTSEEILHSLHYYEELLWILQQQPCYLANLCTRLIGRREDDPEVELVHRVIAQLFNNMKVSRCRNLFKALLNLVMEREMFKCSSVEEVFDPVKSRVAAMMSMLSSNPHFVKTIAMPILDPDNESSLVNLIIRYTISKDAENPRSSNASSKTGGGKGEFSQITFVSGVLACNQGEYTAVDAQDRHERGLPPMSEEGVKKIRQVFQDQLKAFLTFICRGDHTSVGKGEQIESLAQFIHHFIHNVLGESDCADVQMLFKHGFKQIQKQRYVIAFKSADGEQFIPAICSPLSALLLAGVIGGVLNALTHSNFAIIRMRIANKVTAMVQAQYAGKKSEPSQQDIDILTRRVLWNVQSISRFLRRVVHKNVYEVQYPKMDVGDKEEKDLRSRAVMLNELVNDQLYKVLGPHGKYCEDTTETDLTVDMYTSHFSLDREIVWFQTSDILHLTNIIYTYSRPALRDGETAVALDVPAKDRVCQLVTAILPKKKVTLKEGGDVEQTVLWDKDGVIWIAKQVGEWHNFTLRPRFLEFRYSDEYEPTFCEVSMAPIPRNLASGIGNAKEKSQKDRRGIRAVKPFRVSEEERGPKMDIIGVGQDVYPFEELSSLIEELAGNSADVETQAGRIRYPITGSSFVDLRMSMEELQRVISAEIDKGAKGSRNEMLSKLEQAKLMIDKVRETHEERLLMMHIDNSVKRRFEYYQYLDRIKDGAKRIEQSWNEYRISLRNEYTNLSLIVTSTETCEIPEEIKSISQQHSRKLAFVKAKHVKVKMRKNNPTPAQIILEQLVRTSPEGRVTDELRAMVGTPARTFSFKELISKGVLKRLNDKIPKNVANQIKFVFQYEDEGYTVKVLMDVTMLTEFRISREDIGQMECRKKNAILPYGNEFLWFVCSHLRRLLAWIAAEGGP
eukprot:TRINITY_DN29572_c0_g6_i1.p1 TRINITY_DN29572_c0_g6~~TRINITY_DN29572_c0_g6_i1.p1  ORF type:complete len:1953 (-),score=397.88 TRINITY_DN29572_c0_g6_i1:90-5948(-)